jgi:hypothetical protein
MTALNPAAMAWQRFSRGLPEEVRSVEAALVRGLRSFEQWRTCLDTANHLAARINVNIHRRAAGSSPVNVPWRSLKRLANGESLTAEAISKILKVHVDVVRRAMKTFRGKGWVTANATYTKEQPRVFTITELGLSALERISDEVQ